MRRSVLAWALVSACASLHCGGDGPGVVADVGSGGVDASDAADAGPNDVEPNDVEPNGDAALSGPIFPGTGLEALILVEDGDEMPWIRGLQGGHHVFGGLSLAAEVLDDLSVAEREDVLSAYRLMDASGANLASTQRLGGLRRDHDRWVQFGILLVLQPGISPHAVSGQPLTYQVAVDLPSGRRHEAAVLVTTRCCD